MNRRRCCCGCYEAEDDFERLDSTTVGSPWNECSGDWEINDGHLTVDETDAIITFADIASDEDVDGHQVGIFTAELHIYSDSTPVHDSTGAIYRILAFYGTELSPCSSTGYWLMEVEITSKTAGKMRLYDPTSTLIREVDLSFAEEFCEMTLCVDADLIVASTNAAGQVLDEIVAVHGDSFTGYYFALGCGNTTAVCYESVYYTDERDHDPTCPRCLEPCCCPPIEADNAHVPGGGELTATISCPGASMDGASTTLSCVLVGDCCLWTEDATITFACDGASDGGLTFGLEINLSCQNPGTGCDDYWMSLDYGTPDTTLWCKITPEHPDEMQVDGETCVCDPLSLTFGPFRMWSTGFPDYCECCEDLYIVVTET